MVAFHDRRDDLGPSDFNNPRQMFTIDSPRYGDYDEWERQSPVEARPDVASFFRDQKSNATWREANRLAKRRVDHEGRKHGFENGAHYADRYQVHLQNVMNQKGRDLAERNGEIQHKQAGYGRA